MGLGGPVWHASAAPLSGWPLRRRLHDAAHEALAGVGDASLGEWEDWTGRAFHLRRRLSAAEAERVGPVRDVRGTDEAHRRYGRMPAYVRQHMPTDALVEELGL